MLYITAITWFYTVQDIRTLRLPLCVSVTRKWVRPAAEQKDHQQEESSSPQQCVVSGQGISGK